MIMLRKPLLFLYNLGTKFFCYFLLFLLLLNCSDGSNYDENCDFLLNVGVNVSLNLNLSQYNQLSFPSNPVYVPNEGNGGIIVNNTGTGYVAFDAADPNTPLSNNCLIQIIDGIGVSSCDETHKYDLVLGLPFQNTNLRCSLKPYRVERNGNELFVYN